MIIILIVIDMITSWGSLRAWGFGTKTKVTAADLPPSKTTKYQSLNHFSETLQSKALQSQLKIIQGESCFGTRRGLRTKNKPGIFSSPVCTERLSLRGESVVPSFRLIFTILSRRLLSTRFVATDMAFQDFRQVFIRFWPINKHIGSPEEVLWYCGFLQSLKQKLQTDRGGRFLILSWLSRMEVDQMLGSLKPPPLRLDKDQWWLEKLVTFEIIKLMIMIFLLLSLPPCNSATDNFLLKLTSRWEEAV